MSTADVVIVGAGVNGTSTAFHLANAGVKKIVVIERSYLAAGATGKSGALVRTNYGNEPETRLALESLTYFKHWQDLVGGDCGYQPVGLLFFSAPQYAQQLEANLALYRRLGIKTQIITQEGVEQAYIDLCRSSLAKRFPAMRQSALRGSWACMLMFSPDEHPIIGHLPPYDGLYCMVGDSGTSFKTGPAIGKCLAELVTGQPTTVDLTPFRPTRFAEGKPWLDEFSYGGRRPTISR
jgi:glycine/D-amino acid oxidase-like deaminating enzyme